MNVVWGNLLAQAATMFAGMLINISPVVKQSLATSLQEQYDKAKQTDNPWDDFAIKTGAAMLGIEVK